MGLSMNNKKNEKITFIALLMETLLGGFLSGSTSSNEHQNYKTSEKWKVWFKSLFDRENNNKKMNKILKAITNFIIVFIIINLFIFVPLVVKQLKSPRYPVARAYLKSAFMVNELYIVPLSKIFGYGNPLTWPFYPVKEVLYNIGLSKLPKDEGEREIWWFNVRFVEYKTVVQPALMNSYTYNDKTYVPLATWKVNSLKKWHNELYSHILSWPSAKISDPIYKKEKLMRFVDLAEAYVDSTSVMSTKLQITKYDTGRDTKSTRSYPGSHLPYAKPEDVKNYMKIINIFEKLKADSAKNDKQSYDYFEKNKRYYEDKFLYIAGLNLIRSEDQWGNLSCTSPGVQIYVRTNKNLRDYYIQNYKTLKPGERTTIELLATSGMNLPECKSIEVQKYKDFLKRKRKSFKHHMKMIEMFKDK